MNKNLCILVICTGPVAVSRSWNFGPSQSIHCIFAQFSLIQHCALKLPNPQQTFDLLCLWRLHKRLKRSCLWLWACIFSRQIPRYFAGTICPWTSLICVSSPKCVYMCVRRCPSQTPNAFICVSPNAFICVSPNAFICVSPNAFICVSPMRLLNPQCNGARFARLPLLASLARFLTV